MVFSCSCMSTVIVVVGAELCARNKVVWINEKPVTKADDR